MATNAPTRRSPGLSPRMTGGMSPRLSPVITRKREARLHCLATTKNALVCFSDEPSHISDALLTKLQVCKLNVEDQANENSDRITNSETVFRVIASAVNSSGDKISQEQIDFVCTMLSTFTEAGVAVGEQFSKLRKDLLLPNSDAYESKACAVLTLSRPGTEEVALGTLKSCLHTIGVHLGRLKASHSSSSEPETIDRRWSRRAAPVYLGGLGKIERSDVTRALAIRYRMVRMHDQIKFYKEKHSRHLAYVRDHDIKIQKYEAILEREAQKARIDDDTHADDDAAGPTEILSPEQKKYMTLTQEHRKKRETSLDYAKQCQDYVKYLTETGIPNNVDMFLTSLDTSQQYSIQKAAKILARL